MIAATASSFSAAWREYITHHPDMTAAERLVAKADFLAGWMACERRMKEQ